MSTEDVPILSRDTAFRVCRAHDELAKAKASSPNIKNALQLLGFSDALQAKCFAEFVAEKAVELARANEQAARELKGQPQ